MFSCFLFLNHQLHVVTTQVGLAYGKCLELELLIWQCRLSILTNSLCVSSDHKLIISLIDKHVTTIIL